MCVNVVLLFLDEWITPTVTGDRPPPIRSFTLTSVTNNTAILFGGTTATDEDTNNVYIIKFTRTSVVSVLITIISFNIISSNDFINNVWIKLLIKFLKLFRIVQCYLILEVQYSGLREDVVIPVYLLTIVQDHTY